MGRGRRAAGSPLNPPRYTVRILRAAERQFADLPRSVRDELRTAIRALAETPTPAPPHGLKLKGSQHKNRWRLRVGDYRVVYELDRAQRDILVVWAGDRRDAYHER